MSLDTLRERTVSVPQALEEVMSEPRPGLALRAEGPAKFAGLTAEWSDGRSVLLRGRWYLPIKHLCDAALAIVLLAFTSPLIVLGALLVKMTSRGPAFYRQVRVGCDGQLFTLFKLRTMNHDAETVSGPVWCGANDPRITAVGDFLRSTHLDELPQLVNVACGQMSLVGPRPERPEFVANLEVTIPFYRERLRIRPGITGLAQLRLRADTSLESVRRKVVQDIYYVHHLNPVLDLKLLLLTAGRLATEVFRFCGKVLILPNREEIERGFQRAVGIVEIQTSIEAASGPAMNSAASTDTVTDVMAYPSGK